MKFSCSSLRHSRAGGNAANSISRAAEMTESLSCFASFSINWIPACAGITASSESHHRRRRAHFAEDLRRRLAALWPETQIVAVLNDGMAAATRGRNQTRHRLPRHSHAGAERLDAARAADDNCRLVFVTAFDDHAVQAFEQAAVDYLLKPVSDERLERCVERLKQRGMFAPDALLARLQQILATLTKPEPLRWLRIQVGQYVRMVAVEEVCYFQSADK